MSDSENDDDLESKRTNQKITPLQALMQKHGLNASQLERELLKIGIEITADYLRKLASGERGMEKTSVELRQGFKTIFGLGDAEWKGIFNLYVPMTESGDKHEFTTENRIASKMVRVDAYIETRSSPINYFIPEIEYKTGMCVFLVESNSMDTGKPESIQNRDVLYVDRKDTVFKNGKIYIIEILGVGYSIKRARRLKDNNWLLIPDNPSYEPIEVNTHDDYLKEPRLKTIGKVFKVWGFKNSL